MIWPSENLKEIIQDKRIRESNGKCANLLQGLEHIHQSQV